MTSAFPTSSPYANRSSKYTPIEKKFQSPQLALSYLWYYRGSCFSVVHTAADRQSIPHPSDPSFVPELPLCLWHRQNDFAPRPRTRGDACAAPPSAPISIHAPAQGATCGAVHGGGHAAISIHAPAQGATHVYRLHMAGLAISIHAPAQGATTIC